MDVSDAPQPASVAPQQAAWAQHEERGSPSALSLMCHLSLWFGRRATRPILYLIAAYFVVAVPHARHASRSYLARIFGRRATLLEVFRHFFSFACTIHDRIFMLNRREDLFDLRIEGLDDVLKLQAERGGLLLFGSHVGSFDTLRATARFTHSLNVYAAMYGDNAIKITRALAAVTPVATQHILPLGRMESMLMIRDRLAEGALVSILADRSLGKNTRQTVSLLGSEAPLPLGPFRMAATLRVPVVFMICLYRGGNRYDIHFERLADFNDCLPAQREAFTQQVQQRFADRLGHYCHIAPYNWFNFYDFWQGEESPTSPSAP